jgi:hypothetical protein
MDEPNDDARAVHDAGVAPRWGRTTDRRWVRWSRKLKAAFLDHLASTCNVRDSAEAIGVDPGSIYVLRRRDKAFAAAWGEALEAGYEMLETQLVGHALSGGGARSITNGDVEHTGPIDVDLALRLLGTHRGAMAGKPSRGGPKPRTATREETNAVLLRKLKIVETRLRSEAERAAAIPLLPDTTDAIIDVATGVPARDCA